MIRKSNADRQVGERGTGPQPTTVPYNDWKRVSLPPLGAFTPTMGVSVVIPVSAGRLAALVRVPGCLTNTRIRSRRTTS